MRPRRQAKNQHPCLRISKPRHWFTPIFAIKVGAAGGAGDSLSLKQAAREASRKAERKMILESLERTHWNRKRSARELQISYKALLYKIKQYGLLPVPEHVAGPRRIDTA